jgi:rubredoxin
VTYHAGFVKDASIECDSCGVLVPVDRNGIPFAWFLAGKPPRGWKKIDDKHYCPRCKGQYA